ncbi:hypothetical protein FB384_001641 [Prauserella sediminis]|uniref:Uncharacterized protein n=1 Tax=Prauserella sediminis TaxID=577680 RepID=A0A839XJL3_9PSEU|nr:hypothetical protein [Prauserella sediminis]
MASTTTRGRPRGFDRDAALDRAHEKAGGVLEWTPPAVR